MPDKPWEHMHIGYAGPVEDHWLLIVIDTKWYEVIPVPKTILFSTTALCNLFACFG